MNGAALGALLGLGAGAGAVTAVRAAPPLRPIRLTERLAPYLLDTPSPSKLLRGPEPQAAAFPLARALLGPLLADAGTALDRVLGGAGSVRRRLAGLGSPLSVEAFRLEQVLWGAVGMLGVSLLTAAGGLARGHVAPLVVVAGALGGGTGGVLARDWWLTRALTARERAMLAEFPVVADLLALSVVAGESPVDALARVCDLTGGELARDLSGALARVRSGTPLTGALGELAERTTVEAFARFLQGLAVAVERGTPLAEVLRAQAMDVREIGKRALLEAGGRKEIAMMTPVVFLILPVTVLFALYPGLLTLTTLAR